ncbi:hypothetical protein Emtol_0313 (plasmid) [Emticicia oligotrophica DSM 17448]|uniref:CobQ/CobB/MinD/ParA nucleotide binding domain-containing protein n=1 Tax=Emticicia oligotrophica (strain DSM 17448 / CIP 109782 / MTCC 6937 / GPTSA100-15) TaxID=929562 RepID=A0ABN4ASG3_EMTOG|nr:hypothetical protein [Emticicia oligotrophica]AFK05580.1 hypothetical protein Emtol_0313 [Emticicia oligotrophica DSM 17448]
MAKKSIHFIIQSKGGVGKSFLTYLIALKNQFNDSVAFFDLDSSTETSVNQLKFLKEKSRVYKISLLDERKKIIRDRLLTIIKKITQISEIQDFYLDFGAPESEQLPALFSLDFKTEALQKFANQIDAEFIFHVVIAGNTAYVASMEYIQTVIQTLSGSFKIIAHANENSFYGFTDIFEEAKKYCEKQKVDFKPFGDIDTQSHVGNQILNLIRQGVGIEDYDILEQLKIEEEFEKL